MASPATQPRTTLRSVDLDDDTLLERVKGGDDDAFSQLYRRHARHIAGVVYRLLGHDDQLEDIVQDTFIIGLRQLEQLREAAALKRWLTTIAVRRVQRHLASRYRNREMSSELRAVVPRVSEAAAREEVHALYRALDKLPEKLRVPWILHYVEGETLPDVAELCESSLTSVKRHIAAANERLERYGHAS